MIALPWSQRRHFFLIALLFSLFATGCQMAMSSPHASDDDGAIVRNTFPLKFKEHNFGAFCFNTIACKIVYADALHGEEEKSSPPPQSYLKNLSGGHGGIENFPPPAAVTWRSLDGVSHEAKVDIGAIFKDERVLHHVPQEDIPIETVAVALPGPDIILVVDDRTISVYMKAMIFLKKPRLTNNPRSNWVEEPILAYTRTY